MKKFEEYFKYLSKRSKLSKFYRSKLLYPKLNKYLKGKTLDIGCGMGDYISSNKNAQGIDINPLTVEYCKSIGLNVSIQKENKIDFNSNHFDSILLDNVIEHIDKPQTLLSEIYRTLRKGGIFLIGVPGIKGYKSDPDHKIFYDLEKLKNLIIKNNFIYKEHFYKPINLSFLSKYIRQHCLYIIFIKY